MEDVIGLESGSSTAGVPANAPSPRRTELPVLDTGVIRERADAARNRVRVLTAAEHLFAQRGVAAVTMDDVAAAAGVGKGTLYRRFGDKGGLAVALLDDRERKLQRQILTGEPPLGPGAPPAARLIAFIGAYLKLVAAQLDLVLMSETSAPGARLRTGAHAFWRAHCRYLLDAAAAPDPELRADLVLAALAAEQVRHWLHDERRTLEDLIPRLAKAAGALIQPDPRVSKPVIEPAAPRS